MIFPAATALLLMSITADVPAYPPVALVLDTSKSMEGEKMTALREGAKLAANILDRDVVIVSFADRATTSPTLDLRSQRGRSAALRCIDELAVGGGTDYPAALAELSRLPKGTATVFVSDGENTEGTDEEIMRLVRSAPGPIHTVAVSAPPAAQQQLTAMAAESRGSAVAIDDSEQLVKALVELAQGLAGYRAYRPHERQLQFPVTQGEVIAIGYDLEVEVEHPPADRGSQLVHLATLPGEDVSLRRAAVAGGSRVTVRGVRPRTNSARLACVLRNDLARSTLTLSCQRGHAPSSGTIIATARFYSQDGSPIDPRGRDDLKAGYLIRDAQGRTIAKISAKPDRNVPALTASIPLPDEEGPVTIVQVTRQMSGGLPFDDRIEQTIVLERALSLSCDPAEIDLALEVGQQRAVQLSVSLAPPLDDQFAYSATYDGPNEAVRLSEAKSAGSVLTCTFDAKAEGNARGRLVVVAKGPRLVTPLHVPCRFTVGPFLRGLVMPEGTTVDLGKFFSGAGTVDIKPLTIASLDERPAFYSVGASDLASGSDVIALTNNTATIAPTTTQKAIVSLTADVADVAPGVYTGYVDYTLTGVPSPKSWRTNVRLTVRDAVSAAPIHVKAAPGQIQAVELRIQHHGSSPLPGLAIATTDVPAEGGLIEVIAQQSAGPLGAASATVVPVKVSVSPLVRSRGKHQASISLKQASGRTIAVPLTVDVIEAADAASELIVTPGRLSLEVSPAAVAEFRLRVKLPPGAQGADLLQVSAESLSNGNGAVQSPPDLQWEGGNAVTPDKAASLRGFWVAPRTAGVYRSDITIVSRTSGEVRVPITVTVR